MCNTDESHRKTTIGQTKNMLERSVTSEYLYNRMYPFPFSHQFELQCVFIYVMAFFSSLFFSECQFGKEFREIGSSWYLDLGPPFGVMYCMKCECLPVRTHLLFLVLVLYK